MKSELEADIQTVRTMLAPANPYPPGTLSGTARDATARAAFTNITTLTDNRGAGGRAAVGWGLRGPRMAVRLVAVGALAVAIAAGVTVVQSLGGAEENGNPRRVVPGLPAGPVANAQQVLLKAADAAQHRTLIVPRRDQWAYLETKYWRRGKLGGPVQMTVDRVWTWVGGTKVAYFDHGKLVVSSTGGGFPPTDYATLAKLPRDPVALIAYVQRQMPPVENRSAGTFRALASMLGGAVWPPDQEAAIYRAMARIPGVTLNRRTTDARGRPALALSLEVEGWLRQEVLLDPVTYAYRGHRATAIKDHKLPGRRSEWTLKAGTIESQSVRLAAEFVDRPGQRP